MQHVVVTAALVLVTATAVRADIRAGETGRLGSAARVVQEVRGEIPPDLRTSTRCAVVMPELKKAALVVGASKGALAGIDISGGVLRPDEDANAGVYGKGATPQIILASREISAPSPAAPFLNALKTVASPSAAAVATDRGAIPDARPTQTSSVPATPRTTTMATTDDDLRARVVDIEQTLDRVLADTTPAPVGTAGTIGGTPASGTVTVERSRLLQLREQLEALLATLNRR